MSANTEILKEYLLALGFKVDQKSTNTFDQTVRKLDLSAVKLYGSLAAAATGAVALATTFARSMEKLYYSSEKSGAAVGNIQAFAFAEKQVGLASGTMQAALEGMGRAMRTNPGLIGLVQSFGIPVTGRDMADVAMDLVKVLGKMPHFVGAQYANLFGIDSDTLFLLTKHVDEFEKAAAARRAMAKEAGVDADKAAAAGKEYAQALNEVLEMLGLIKDVVAIELLPMMKTMVGYILEAGKSLISIIGDAKERGFLKQLNGVAEQVVYDWKKTLKGHSLSSFGKQLWEGVFGIDHKPAVATGSGSPVLAPPSPVKPAGKGAAPPALFGTLEKTYGLPEGLLDRMWAKESGRGQNMLSKAGAQGHFQFMPATQKEYGLKDPMDLAESAEAAARKMRDLMRLYKGDVQMALAAYNWGQGNIAKQGIENAPWETRDYVAKISGKPLQITNNTEIKVYGPDPATTARNVAQAQVQVANDTARYQANLGVR